MRKTLLFLFCSCLLAQSSFAQGVNIQGYTFARNNSGFIGAAEIRIAVDGVPMPEMFLTDPDGKFQIQLPAGKKYEVIATKNAFNETRVPFSTEDKKAGEWVYLKVPMDRMPGYLLEGSLSEMANQSFTLDTMPGTGPAVNAIDGATIEMYNNTEHRQVLRLIDNPGHQFSFLLEQGNEYIMLIRKGGYFNKRARIKVNIKGCILCCEGVGNITPGIVDNLTHGNTMGTLAANITMKRIIQDEGIRLDNIYYPSNSSELTAESKKSLDKLVTILKENPQLIIEVRSHTDSRGSAEDNLKLSQNRADAAMEYLVAAGVRQERLKAVGMGESKPVNKCKDGVPCTDAQYLVNRRTEFAVVDFLQDPYDGQSLASIMMEEEMGEILEANGSSYFEAPANPADSNAIKSKIKESEHQLAEKVKHDPIPDPSEEAPAPPPVKAPKIKGDPIPDAQPETPAEETVDPGTPDPTQIEEAVDTSGVMEIDSVTHKHVKHRHKKHKGKRVGYEDGETPLIQNSSSPALPNREGLSTANTAAVIQPEKPAVVNKSKELTVLTIQAPRSIPKTYDGYVVEVVSNKYELPLNDKLFVSFRNIMVDRSVNSKVSYLVGNFDKYKEARDYMKNSVRSLYPESRIITYKKGIRYE